MAALALTIAAGCESKKEAVMASGLDLGNLDTTVVHSICWQRTIVSS